MVLLQLVVNALEKTVLLAYMSWEGYNFEDVVLISERFDKPIVVDTFFSVPSSPSFIT